MCFGRLGFVGDAVCEYDSYLQNKIINNIIDISDNRRKFRTSYPTPLPLHSFPSFPLPPLPYPDIAPEKQETNLSKEKNLLMIRPHVQHHLPSACGIGGGATLPRDGPRFCNPFDIGMDRNLVWRGKGWRQG